MTKKTRNMLLLSGVLVVLLAAYALVSLLGGSSGTPPAQGGTPSDQTEAYPVYTLDASKLDAFVTTFGGASYAYRLSEDGEKWSWDGDATLPISNTEITLMMTPLTSLSSTVCYENVPAEKLIDYGIDDHAQSIRLVCSDGTEETLIFGKVNAYAGGTYCVRASLRSTVYVVDSGIPAGFAVLPTDIVENDKLPTYTVSHFSGFLWEWQGVTYTAEYDYVGDASEEDAQKQLLLSIGGGEMQPCDAALGDALIAEIRGWKLKDALTFDPARYAELGVTDETENTLSIYYTYVVEHTDETTGAVNNMTMQGMYRLLLGDLGEDGSIYVRLSDAGGVYALSMPTLMGLCAEQPTS